SAVSTTKPDGSPSPGNPVPAAGAKSGAPAGAVDPAASRQPEDAGLQLMPGDPRAGTVTAAVKGERSSRAASAAEPPAGTHGRQAEDGDSSSGSRSVPSASKSAADRLTTTLQATPAGAAAAGNAPEGHDGTEDVRAEPVKAGHRTSARETFPQE